MSTTALQLPGIYFAPETRQTTTGLPPLDVAALVGFAERGPLHFPVALSDINMYRDIFGGDLGIAKDEKGQTAYAHLPRCISAFFANGGRRCYVVRVAGNGAKSARLPIPGMIAVGEKGDIGLASLSSASPGRWGNQLRLASRLKVTPLPETQFDFLASTRLIWGSGGAPQAIEAGDILRLRSHDQRYLFPVSKVVLDKAGDGETVLETVRLWRLISSVSGIAEPARIVQLKTTGGIDIGAGRWNQSNEGIGLNLTGKEAVNVQQGDILRLELNGGGEYFFPVAVATPLLSKDRGVQVWSDAMLDSAQPVIEGMAASPRMPQPLQQVERLRFDMLLRVAEEVRPIMAELAFNAGHSRFFGDVVLLESSLRYRNMVPQQRGDNPYANRARLFRMMQRKAGPQDSAPQYRRIDPVRDGTPDAAMLAGLLAPAPAMDDSPVTTPDKSGAIYLPLGMLTEASSFAGPSTEDDLGDDDLANFNEHTASLFLDPTLVPDPNNPGGFTKPAALLATAFERYYTEETRLLGLHSLIYVDEVALLGVPDAVHRNWSPGKTGQILPGTNLPKPAAIAMGEFSTCRQPPVVQSITPGNGPLSGDGLKVILAGDGFMAGETAVKFDGTPAGDVQMVDSKQLSCRLPPGGRAGWVTVTVETKNGSFTFPEGFQYRQSPSAPLLPQMAPVQDYDPIPDPFLSSPLLPIHQGLIQLCEARADLTGILSLPAHYEKRQCITWRESLRGRLGLPSSGGKPADGQDIADLSFVAVYHPWLLSQEQGSATELISTPPDGAVLGMIAARELDRQVWVAPANVPLRGVLGLAPSLSTADAGELFSLRFNLIRREVRGFSVISAHTLSDERNLLQLSVRRLLILLRKVALEKGMDFVFENNTERFRGAIRVPLENMLRLFFEQGAFAGLTHAEAFRLVMDDTVNSSDSMEKGRLIVQIQIAPSQPLEFMTVFLVRGGTGLLQAVEG